MTAAITWYGHATFRLVLPDGRVVFIDPWLEGNPSCPPALKKPDRCDLVLLTHGHADHIGGLEMLIDRFNPVVVANYDLCAALTGMLGKGRFEGMNTGGTLTFGSVCISLTRAYHSSAVETPRGLVYGGMPNGVVVAAEGAAVLYHAGDTDVFSDMQIVRRLFAPRVCILPIGDRFTMGAAGAALAAEWLDPATIIPCHYATFPILAPNADAFREALNPTLRERLVVVQPGEALRWTSDGAGR